MKANELLLLFLFLPAALSAQAPKGAMPLPAATAATTVTRAVVVGISDYQDPAIPDLKYAHRDAEAFANWLRSPNGAGMSDTNIVLLTNAKATGGKMMGAFDWLIESCKPGDRAFIYFSGHGDVERVTKFQRGFLLNWDAPPAVYSVGAFSLLSLQDIITTLSENNVQVIVVTDACRAGKLAGSEFKGAQATAVALSRQFANEIKILSCQPEEFSLEGEQWGGGRGCFSYHLEDALYGLADANADETVDLSELRRYLEDHVSREAAPQPQTPMVMGPVRTAIATAPQQVAALRRTEKNGRPVTFQAIENRGLESLESARTDSSLRRLYERFLAAIDSGRLMSPPGDCADDLFRRLENRPEMAALKGSMKRTLAAALIDEGQILLNKILQTDPATIDNIWANKIEYDHLPGYYRRAAEILGEQHYAYKSIKAKEFYFRGKTVRSDLYPDSTRKWLQTERRRFMDAALSYDSTSALLYFDLVDGQVDIKSLKKAVKLAPNWALAHYCLGFLLVNILRPEEGVVSFRKAIEINPAFLPSYYFLGFTYDDLGKRDSAMFWKQEGVSKFMEKLRSDSSSITAYEYTTIANLLYGMKEYERALAYFKLAEQRSQAQYPDVYNGLCKLYVERMEYEKAIEAFEKGTALINNTLRQNDCIGAGLLQNIYFYFLNDREKTMQIIKDQHGDRCNQAQNIQIWYALDKPKALAIAHDAKLPELKNWWWKRPAMAFYGGESARDLGMPDSATTFYRLLADKVKPSFEPFARPMMIHDFILVAIARHRLGEMEAYQQLVDTARIQLAGDPALYFYLACIYANTDQPEAAIDAMRQAAEQGWQQDMLWWVWNTICDPMLDPIRETDAFKALVRHHFPKYYDVATRVAGRP